MNNKPLLVANLLGSKASRSKALIAEAKRLSQINIVLNQSLDQQLAEHIYVSTLVNGLLTLVVDSPAWATRLRYMQPTIIADMKKYAISSEINQIKIKVRPADHIKAKKAPRAKRELTISHESAEIMQESLNAISDPGLKASLSKIIRHAKSKK